MQWGFIYQYQPGRPKISSCPWPFPFFIQTDSNPRGLLRCWLVKGQGSFRAGVVAERGRVSSLWHMVGSKRPLLPVIPNLDVCVVKTRHWRFWHHGFCASFCIELVRSLFCGHAQGCSGLRAKARDEQGKLQCQPVERCFRWIRIRGGVGSKRQITQFLAIGTATRCRNRGSRRV